VTVDAGTGGDPAVGVGVAAGIEVGWAVGIGTILVVIAEDFGSGGAVGVAVVVEEQFTDSVYQMESIQSVREPPVDFTTNVCCPSCRAGDWYNSC
jgi:hypothetical protein